MSFMRTANHLCMHWGSSRFQSRRITDSDHLYQQVQQKAKDASGCRVVFLKLRFQQTDGWMRKLKKMQDKPIFTPQSVNHAPSKMCFT